MSDTLFADLVLLYTLKDIDPSNDDQRKAAFARMTSTGDAGGGSGGRYEGKLSRGKTSVRAYNSSTRQFTDKLEVNSTGVGDYVYHKPAGYGAGYTVTHKPTGLMMARVSNKKSAEEVVRRLHGSNVKIRTVQRGDFLEPDSSHPSFNRASQSMRKILTDIGER